MPTRRSFIGTALGFIAALFTTKLGGADEPVPPRTFVREASFTTTVPAHKFTGHEFTDPVGSFRYCTNAGCLATEYDSEGIRLVRGITDPCPARFPADDQLDEILLGYTDLWQMLDAIAEYTRKTGNLILCADDPLADKLGFCNVPSTGEPQVIWRIRLDDMARSLAQAEKGEHEVTKTPTGKLKAQLMGMYIKTREGRLTIARAFPGQGRKSPLSSPSGQLAIPGVLHPGQRSA